MASHLLRDALVRERPAWRRALWAGTFMALSTIGLAGTSAWLIVRAAQHPVILSLTLPMGLVQLFALAKAGGRYAERTQTHRAALSAMGHVRAAVAATIAPLFPAGLGPRSSDVVTTALQDVERVQDVLTAVAGPLTTSVVAGVATVVVAGALVPWAGIALVGALVVTGGLVPLLAAAAGRRTQQRLGAVRANMATLWSDAASAGSELLFGGTKDRLRERLADLERRYDALVHRQALVTGAIQGLGVLVSGATVVVEVVATRSQVLAGHLGVAVVAVPALLAVTALELVSGVAPNLVGLRSDLDALNRLNAFAVVDPPVHEPVVERALATGDLTLTAVSRHFGVDEVLRDVTCRLAEGDVITLEGPSGAGKSTVGWLIAKFLDPSSGVVAMGGTDYRLVSAPQVRTRVGYVDDTPHIFATTLAANVRVARPDATDAEVLEACRGAGLAALIASREPGLSMVLGGASTGLSGGEQRRVGLARALLVKRDVWVLDEPTEGLDEVTASRVLDALVENVGQGCLLIISHRARDYRHATRRWRLSGGRLDELSPLLPVG